MPKNGELRKKYPHASTNARYAKPQRARLIQPLKVFRKNSKNPQNARRERYNIKFTRTAQGLGL